MSHTPTPEDRQEARASTAEASPRTYEASVTAIEGPLSLRIRGAGQEQAHLARLATAGPYRPQVGDEVLVTQGGGGKRYVIGVLRALRESSEPAPEPGEPAPEPGELASLRMEEGSSARIEQGEDGEEVLRVRDKRGALLFEHRGKESLLCAPEGDLRLSAPRGEVRIEAGAGVKVRAKGRLELESERGLRLRSAEEGEEGEQAREEALQSELELSPRGLKLGVEELAVDSARADLVFGKARVFGEQLESSIRDARQRFLKLEQKSELWIQKAGSLYREVEDLEQSRAGRIKLFAKEALKQLAKSVRVQAEREVTVDGEKIYIG